MNPDFFIRDRNPCKSNDPKGNRKWGLWKTEKERFE